jgi:PadR family transcriptional regulator, regulatory protein PadR
MLGELEQIVMLAILRLGDDAYGVPIAHEIEEQTSRELTLATIYKTLNRLETKGLVHGRVGEPTAARGGRRKRYYMLTTGGRTAVKHSLSVLRRMTRGLQVGLDLSP